jgi:hypothetical protein
MAGNDSNLTENSEATAVALASVKREIDTLKSVLKKPQPWYRDGSLLLAAVAFLFSLFTFYRQDQNDTQIELRNVLKDLYSLPQVDADAKLKFGNSAEEMMISTGLNHQKQVLSLQAYALAKHLGRGLAFPERSAVADAMAQIQPSIAEKLLTEVPIPTDNIEDFMGAKRILGSLQIASNQPDLGDQNFQAAKDILKSSEWHIDPAYQSMSNVVTESFWSQAYLVVGNCQQAVPHLQAAQGEFNKLTGTPMAEAVRQQLDLQQRATRTRCGA